MAKTLKLKIATPEKVIMNEEVEKISVPTTMGEITVLPDHIPLITELGSGDIVVYKEEEPIPMAVVGGFLQVKPDEVIVLADFAELIEGITDTEVQDAIKRAEELKKNKDKVSKEEFEYFATELERALTRARIHGKWRSKKYRKLNINKK